MASLMGHVPETDELAVIGTSAADTLLATASRVISLAEVVERLKADAPEAAAVYEVAVAAAREVEARRAEECLKVREFRYATTDQPRKEFSKIGRRSKKISLFINVRPSE
jgi:hypothetical protein